MSKFTTLVFQSDTPESLKKVREMAHLEICKAWSMDNEIRRVELIELALENNDIDKVHEYLSAIELAQDETS